MDFLRRDKFNLAAEPVRCVIAAACMLGHSAFKIVGRTYVITPSAPQDVNPTHIKEAWVGRDSNPEPTP